MIEYEKSYEDYEDPRETPVYVCESEEPEYIQILTEMSQFTLRAMLKTLEEFTRRWKGKMIVSYDDIDPIRDYTIRVIVRKIDFYNSYLLQVFGDLMLEADYVTIVPCEEEADKVEIVVIQSNADIIHKDEFEDYGDDE